MKRPEGFDHGRQKQPPKPGRATGAGRQAPKQRQEVAPAQKRPDSARGSASGAPLKKARPVADVSSRELRKSARERRRFERAEVRRFTRHSRRRRAAWGAVVAVVAVLAIVLGVAVFSPILALREVAVTGTDRLSEAEITDAVGGQLNTPLALLDFDRIEKELAQFVLIRSYVTETVPPGTLIIHIVERQPVGTLLRGGVYDQVDPAGVVIATTEDPGALPVIDVGGQSVDSAAFRSAVEVILALPDSVRAGVDTVEANTPNDVRLALKGVDPAVVWGSAVESELKGSVLQRLLARGECASVAVIDVSAPLAPICGPG